MVKLGLDCEECTLKKGLILIYLSRDLVLPARFWMCLKILPEADSGKYLNKTSLLRKSR